MIEVVKVAAPTYTPIKLEEMERFLMKAFYSLKPKKGFEQGEITFDLFLSDGACIRVYTSLRRSGNSAGVGADAIRIGLFSVVSNRPMKRGSFPIVKRTQGWRDNLKDRIEDEIEYYYSTAGDKV
jgi:hypothetical protein